MTGTPRLSAPPVPRRIMLTYGVGQMGAQIFRDTPAVLLPLFMVTMLGVPAWAAGLAILVPKMWVIICDPLVGSLSDRLEARRGRAPMLAAGALLSSIGFFALFALNDYGAPATAAVTISLIYLLASTGFSAFSVPYLALAAELSGDPHERTKILTYRMAFTLVGVLLGVGAAQPLIHRFGGGQHGWLAMAAIFATICLGSMMATAVGLWRFRAPAVRGTGATLRRQLATAWHNRPFRLLTLTHFFQSVAQACSYSVIGLMFLYPIGKIGLMMPFVLAISLAGLASQPFWLLLSRRFGKLRSFLAACFAWAGVTVTWFFVGWAADAAIALPWPGAIPLEDALVLLRGVGIGLTNSGFVLLAISMLTDAVNHGKIDGEAAREGSFAGVWSASEKLAFAIGPAISGVVLSYFGFQSSTGGGVEQPESALTGILLSYSLIPAFIFIASLVCLRGYAQALRRPQ